jgi:hypothetical protein
MSDSQVMQAALEHLPSVRRYIDAVSEDLCGGTTVIALLPASIDPELVGGEIP